MIIYLLVFLSGLAGLIYEILWMKQLGLLFGNTSHAAAATLAAFFAGLAVGSWVWGRNAAKLKNPLRAYAWLQVGIAATALLYFAIIGLYYRIYPFVYQRVDSTSALLLIKFALALLLIFPPAFLMGGTIPVIGQYMVRSRSKFGITAALLYGINTLGAASGALLAGFFLPLWLGFRLTCVAAMAVSGLIAVSAFLLSRNPAPREDTDAAEEMTGPAFSYARWALMVICFVSGFGVLALEVVWTRMFTQVLENSVYTFAAILVMVLICLSAGALISSLLARLKISPVTMLAVLLVLSGLLVAGIPFVFMKVTNSLQILALRASWADYLFFIFRKGFVVIGLPALVLGTIFPYLMKSEEKHAVSAGRSLGRLSAVNTVGAILGSLVCGFILLGTLGMWRTMRVLAAVYVVAAMFLPIAWGRTGIAIRAVAAAGVLAIFTVLDPAGLPVNSIDPRRPPETILKTWEGSDCTVAVASDHRGLSIKINSHYGLGSTGAAVLESLQCDIPLMIQTEANSIFFLGMGTGITAGSALHPQFSNVTRVVACELVPEVVEAAEYIAEAEKYDYVSRLFEDPRATIVIEDGRHYLMATADKYDQVNSDLFIPFRSGAGSLYSKEHFESVKKRLEPGGVFFQWIPLYQVTSNELFIIGRTMLEVFDQVSLWRNNFQPGDEVVAFAGHMDTGPLPPCEIDSRSDRRAALAGMTHRHLGGLRLPFNPEVILFFYCGNLTKAKSLFADYPVNTDDRPMIEYMAPRTYRRESGVSIPWFVGPRLASLVEEIQRICPAESDPLLVNRTPAARKLAVAAMAYHRARIWQVIGDEAACRKEWARFVREYTR